MGNPPFKHSVTNIRTSCATISAIRSVISFARLVGHFDRAIKASRVGSCFDFVVAVYAVQVVV